MSRLVARLAAILAPVALLLPAAAHAEQLTVDDGVGDAKAVNFASVVSEAAEGEPLFLDAPAETSVDIVRTIVTHGKRLSLAVSFRDLAQTAEHSLDIRIITPEGRFNLMAAVSADGSAHAELYPSRVVAVAGQGPFDIRPCRSVRARYDVDADLVTVSAPAKCVGAPRWVQVAVVASRLSVTPIGDGSVNLAGYGDDAFRGGLSERTRGRSPKVRRG